MVYTRTYVDRIIGSYAAQLNMCAWEVELCLEESSPANILLEPDDDIIESILYRRRRIIRAFRSTYINFLDFCKVFKLDGDLVLLCFVNNNTKRFIDSFK